ncbi:DUF6233 domain-containing protein [Streptomyces spororaveus]|uniref:DUF6233 domain-containing protein n=1 Tax=Streptomyces spororaveus TaxID=284039 RepID=UPI00368E166E
MGDRCTAAPSARCRPGRHPRPPAHPHLVGAGPVVVAARRPRPRPARHGARGGVPETSERAHPLGTMQALDALARPGTTACTVCDAAEALPGYRDVIGQDQPLLPALRLLDAQRGTQGRPHPRPVNQVRGGRPRPPPPEDRRARHYGRDPGGGQDPGAGGRHRPPAAPGRHHGRGDDQPNRCTGNARPAGPPSGAGRDGAQHRVLLLPGGVRGSGGEVGGRTVAHHLLPRAPPARR